MEDESSDPSSAIPSLTTLELTVSTSSRTAVDTKQTSAPRGTLTPRHRRRSQSCTSHSSLSWRVDRICEQLKRAMGWFKK